MANNCGLWHLNIDRLIHVAVPGTHYSDDLILHKGDRVSNFLKVSISVQSKDVSVHKGGGATARMDNQGGGGAGKARFNVATPTYEARTRPLHVQHTYYRIIFKQNPFNIISRGVER